MSRTGFPELDEVLRGLVEFNLRLFADDLIGIYLTGSFALGDADAESDCDFLVVVRHPLSPEQESEIRQLHRRLPGLEGHWTKHLEGSYAPRDDLISPERVGALWLHIPHGETEMEWSEHCNRAVVRWTLHEHGLPLVGPDPKQFVAPVPADAVRASMRADIPTLEDDILAWANPAHAWTQRYLVTAHCRALYSLVTGAVASKPAALRWAEQELDRRWMPLLAQVRQDRSWGLHPHPPRPGSMAEALEFSKWCREWAAGR